MNEQILNLITSSFLPKDAKEQLVYFLNNYGATPEFYEKFDALLMEELKKRNDRVTSILDSYDKDAGELEAEFLKAKESLDNKLNEELSAVDKIDISKKNEIWESYYKKISELEADFGVKLKNIVSQKIVSNL